MYYIVLYFVVISIFTEVSMKNMVILFSFLSFLISTIIVFILKFTIKRKRKSVGNDVFLRELDPYSFPSGHVTRITAVLAPLYGMYLIIYSVLFIAIIVSVARIVKGFHYPSDCIAGIIIGFFSSYISYIFIQLIPF